MADYIYIGPTLSRYGLKNYETYKDRPSGNILELMNKYPAVASLVVPQAELVAKQKEVNKKGTALYAAYQSVSDESAFGSNVGNGPIITPTEPIPPFRNPYFSTPVPGKQYNSAGEIVNPADYYGPNGLKVDGLLTPKEVMLFDNVGVTTEVNVDGAAYSTAILEVSRIEDGVVEVYGKLSSDTLMPLNLVSQSGSDQSSASNIGLFYISNLGFNKLVFKYKPSIRNSRFCSAKVLLTYNQNEIKAIDRPRKMPSISKTLINNAYEAPLTIKKDIVYGRREALLRQSVDYGKTWTTVATLPANINIAMVADNGRIACVLNDGTVYTSDTNGANFTKTLTITGGVPHASFGYSIYKNMMFLAEYNSIKTPPTAKRVYMSVDGGATWKTGLEVNDSPGNFHTHGVQYDPYEDIIWVVTGDGVQSKMIFYSVDRGVSWDKVAPWGQAPVQACTVIPLPDCVLFIGDSFQVAVHRYVRPKSGTVKGQSFIFERAMLLQNDWDSGSEVPIPSLPVIDFSNNRAYFGWILTPNAIGGGYVLKNANIFYTSDGFNFSQVFSTELPANGTGVGKGLGLATDGSPVFHLNDLNQGSYSHSTLKLSVSGEV